MASADGAHPDARAKARNEARKKEEYELDDAKDVAPRSNGFVGGVWSRVQAAQPPGTEVQVAGGKHDVWDQDGASIQGKVDGGGRSIDGPSHRPVDGPSANGPSATDELRTCDDAKNHPAPAHRPAEEYRMTTGRLDPNHAMPDLTSQPPESLAGALLPKVEGVEALNVQDPERDPKPPPQGMLDARKENGTGAVSIALPSAAPEKIRSEHGKASPTSPVEDETCGLVTARPMSGEAGPLARLLDGARKNEQTLPSGSKANARELLGSGDPDLENDEKDKCALPEGDVDAEAKRAIHVQGEQDAGKGKRKLGEIVNLKSKKSSKRGTKAKQAQATREKEQTVQVSRTGNTAGFFSKERS